MKRFIGNFEEIISGVALSIVIAVVVLNVIMRYIFNMPLNWAEEIATIGFVWCVFLGSSACYKRHMHIGIDVVVQLFPESAKRIVLICTDALLIITNIYLTYLSLTLSISAWMKPTAVLLIPYTFVDISAALGFILMIIHSVRFFLQDLKSKA